VAALEGKTAIVTGASSGIGAATAAALAREGARVAGGARRVDELQTEIKLELDVTDRESCERFVEAAVGELGGLDILINNAGLGLGRDPFWKSTEEDEETVLETNVEGLIRITRLCLPDIRDGGHIVNMGSIAGASPTRTPPSMSRPSTPCAASPTRSVRTASAARSG
jgi:NADP-dependent 3-hydroxy acid dehydrogenase YdfG